MTQKLDALDERAVAAAFDAAIESLKHLTAFHRKRPGLGDGSIDRADTPSNPRVRFAHLSRELEAAGFAIVKV